MYMYKCIKHVYVIYAAAFPAVPFVGAADNLARRWIYSDKRYRHPTLHQNTFGGRDRICLCILRNESY